MNFIKRQRIALIRLAKIVFFAASVFFTTKLILITGALTNTSTAAFSFLIIVVLSAFFGDLLVAMITSFLATICFDYFYLPPVGTFTITAFADWISLVAFLLTSVVISQLTAAAVDHKTRADILNQTHSNLKKLGTWLISISKEQLTLSEIAKNVLTIFSLEYCSIHMYEKGKWQHFTGTATTSIPDEIEQKLKKYQDHLTDISEIADEDFLGVRFIQIKKRDDTIALLVVKSDTLPVEALESIAYMIGTRLTFD
jgi:two-component system sensor histidine kinase KdpD